jgi:DNA-binding MarR family transcriptional regulator
MEQAAMRRDDAMQPERVLPLLQMVSDLVERRCDRFLGARYNLTTPQYLLLLAAHNRGETTLGTLSTFLHCSRGNITGIVDRLERDGWLVRERSTDDRRVIKVNLTEKGKTVTTIREELARELSGMAAVWTAQERDQLTGILNRMYDELKD